MLPSLLLQAATSGADINCNLRDAALIDVVDVTFEKPIMTLFTDTDGQVRTVQGDVKIIPPAHAGGLQGWRFYPTADGFTALTTAEHLGVMNKRCPADGNDSDNVPAEWGKVVVKG